MSNTLKRVMVVITAVNTYLVAGALIVSIITEEVAEELPSSTAEAVVKIGGKVVGWLGAAIAILRRSTPVILSQRGLLPPPEGEPIVPTANVVGVVAEV